MDVVLGLPLASMEDLMWHNYQKPFPEAAVSVIQSSSIGHTVAAGVHMYSLIY